MQIDLVFHAFEIHITRTGGADSGKIIFPIGTPFQPYGFAGDQGLGPGGRLVFFGGPRDQLVIIIGPGLIVFVDIRKIRVVKNLQ
jgi:hypothetical protein